MKWLLGVVASAALATVLTASATTAATTPRVPAPRTVASWNDGSFAESMALGADGALYVSRTTWGDTTNVAAIDRVPLFGGKARTVTSVETAGLFAGVAFDAQHRLYVASAYGDQTEVARVDEKGKLTPVLLLPSGEEGAFPNGLAFLDGYLYVTDPAWGAIWRVQPGRSPVTQVTPWLQVDDLLPGATLGPDGIAFRGRTMYVTQYDRGQILTATIAADGSPGPFHVLAEDPRLKTADGIAFGPFGELWVTVNGDGDTDRGRLVVVTPAGRVPVVADNAAWLDYPTQPVVALPWGVFLVNGSFKVGAPSVVGWSFLPF